MVRLTLVVTKWSDITTPVGRSCEKNLTGVAYQDFNGQWIDHLKTARVDLMRKVDS